MDEKNVYASLLESRENGEVRWTYSIKFWKAIPIVRPKGLTRAKFIKKAREILIREFKKDTKKYSFEKLLDVPASLTKQI
jgi:hypothetical protein